MHIVIAMHFKVLVAVAIQDIHQDENDMAIIQAIIEHRIAECANSNTQQVHPETLAKMPGAGGSWDPGDGAPFFGGSLG